VFAATGLLILIAIIVGVVLVAAIILFLVMRAWVKVARADEALVVSGRKQKTTQGDSPVTVIVNGKAIVNPITQRHEVISLRSRQVELSVSAQSLDNVTLDVKGVALVKISSDPQLVRAAAERFASQDQAVSLFTTEQLEGALRGVIAKLTVVELMRERARFAEEIADSVRQELRDQGLVLDSFQIKGIEDQVGYIQSLGALEIEARKRDAAIARTDAERAVAKKAIANREANLVEQTALDKNAAAAQAEVGKARAEAEQAEALAGARAQQAVLQQHAENTQAKLDAEVKRVADAKAYEAQKAVESRAFEEQRKAEVDAQKRVVEANAATQVADAEARQKIRLAEAARQVAESEAAAVRLRAEADSESVRLAGQAKADAIRAEAEALEQNREAVLAQRALDVLPELMTAFAKGYANVGSISIVGGPTDAASVVGAEQAVATKAVFESLRETTGIDVAALIQGQTIGRGIGEGLRENGAHGAPTL